MYIVMITQSYYLRDPRVRREAEALTEVGHQVDVICLRDKGESYYFELDGVRIYRLPLRRRRGGFLRYIFEYFAFFLLSCAYLSILQVRRRYRLVHVHNMPNFLVFATWLPRLWGAKIILDMHDPMPELFQSQFRLPSRHWVIRLLELEESLSCRYPHYLLTVNESMRQRLIVKGVHHSRVRTLLNSPDLGILCQNPDRFPKKVDAFTLVYAGTIARRYGLDIAIRGLKLLTRDMNDIRLLIVGEGNCLNDLRKLVDELNLHQHVIFRGKVPLEEIPEILAQCDVGISPHRNGPFEKLCLFTKILESLAMGLPVISSRTKTVEYYLGDSIFFFEPEDVDGFAEQVRLIRKNPQLVADKMKKAEQKLQELSWNREKGKLQKLVEKLVPPKTR